MTMRFALVPMIFVQAMAVAQDRVRQDMQELRRLHQDSKAHIAFLDILQGDAYRKPHELPAALDLQEAGVIADIGAGSAHFAFRFACQVLAKARVHPTAPAPPPDVGDASWYGHPYHGRQAASGEIYDMNKLTAAHRTLPFGTWVRVHNLANAGKVDVKINDRGPFVEGRLIDLSRAAARALGFLAAGLARVRLEVLPARAVTLSETHAVQVGAFRVRANAERLRKEMETRFGSAVIVPHKGDPVLWRVLVGRVSGRDAAEALLPQIRSQEGSGVGAAFIVCADEIR